ncbi:hypothetical protein I4U23_021120 [Adineta vaga]|nr:hypothetical protein I4U23_021120 [Adineta vaga]
MYDNYRSSRVAPLDTSSASMNDLLPTSARVSQIQTNYRNDEKQILPYQSNRPSQPWQTDPYSSNSYQNPPSIAKQVAPAASTKKFLIIASVLGVIIGLCMCGIPLGVITTLYLKLKSDGSATCATTGSSSVSLPPQCTTYTTISEANRLTTCTGSYYTDCSWTAGWYRVTGGGATKLATVASSTNYCCTSYPGWFNGTLPTTSGATTIGMYCINYSGNLCYSPWSVSTVLVTNCDVFYVYYLPTITSCNSRYCTTY